MRARIALLTLALSATTAAHENGATRVAVTVDSRHSYVVALVTDAATIVERLESASGEDPSQHLTPTEMQWLLKKHDETFRRKVTLTFDDARVDPVITYAVRESADHSSPPIATITLRGPIPEGAGHLRWQYGWTFASYELSVGTPNTPPATHWLEGDEVSGPFDVLTSPLALSVRIYSAVRAALRDISMGFSFVVPIGFGHMWFAIGLFLIGGGLGSTIREVGAFTAAQTVTIWTTILGVTPVPPSTLGPLVALSVGCVAVVSATAWPQPRGRTAIALAFGLLHGLSCASPVEALELSRSEVWRTVIPFSVGIGIAQLAIVGAALVIVGRRYQVRHLQPALK